MSFSSFVCLHRAHEQQPFRDYHILHSQIVIVDRDSGKLIILLVDKNRLIMQDRDRMQINFTATVVALQQRC